VDVNRKVQLDGHPEELGALAKMCEALVAPVRVIVWSEDGTYYLHAPEFEGMADARAVLRRGEALVGRLNGIGVLKFGAFRPVRAVAVRQARPAVHYAMAALDMPTDALRAYLDYTPDRPPAMNAIVGPIVAALPAVEKWIGLADRHAPHVDDALQLLALAARSGDWRVLYVVYEIVEDLVGNQKVRKLGASRRQITLFERTAQKHRHARGRHVPPKRPMTFAKATALVRSLLLAALSSL
jgi:hypothetical protein